MDEQMMREVRGERCLHVNCVFPYARDLVMTHFQAQRFLASTMAAPRKTSCGKSALTISGTRP
jgi:hypothetical protein